LHNLCRANRDDGCCPGSAAREVDENDLVAGRNTSGDGFT
jgi:hypothetical protein